MSDYVKVPTSPEVWAVIRARHAADLEVYGTFSNPCGGELGSSPDRGEMMTLYSLRGADVPLIGARSTWAVRTSESGDRVRFGDEHHEYWLCAIPARGD